MTAAALIPAKPVPRPAPAPANRQTTIEGVLALEQGGFSYTVQNAVTAAYRRTVEMTKKG